MRAVGTRRAQLGPRAAPCPPLLAVAAGWAFFALCACAQRSATGSAAPGPARSEPIAVSAAPVQVRPAEQAVAFVGTLYGAEEVTLASQIEGQIRAVRADLGDRVEAGAVLAEIDDDALRAQLREAEAHLQKARADEARGRQLLDQRVASQAEYETLKTTVAVAEARREVLRVLIERARVRAPLSGWVARREVTAGEYVRPGSPLFALVADDPLKLRGEVPERFAPELRTGQRVRVQVDAFSGETFAGTLSRIGPAANAANRSVPVEVVVENRDRRLKPGFFAQAAIVTRANDRALAVPQEAVATLAGVSKVFAIRDHVAREQRVRLGTRFPDGWVEVLEGIDPGALVATSGLGILTDGASVRVRDEAQATSG